MRKLVVRTSSVFVACLLIVGSVHAQSWSNITPESSQVKFYKSSEFDSYSFVGVATFFGAEFTYNKSGGVITKIHHTSPASDFNFGVNDVVTTIGKFKILSAEDYEKALEYYKPNDEVSVSYIRDGEERSRIVVLEKINVYKHDKTKKKLELPTSIIKDGTPEKIKVLDTKNDKN